MPRTETSPPAPPVAPVDSQAVRELRHELGQLRAEFHAVKSALEEAIAVNRRELDDLNRQLGN